MICHSLAETLAHGYLLWFESDPAIWGRAAALGGAGRGRPARHADRPASVAVLASKSLD
ncbi:MAG: hypothetical protein ACOCWF_02115 [Halochromatium sp.]